MPAFSKWTNSNWYVFSTIDTENIENTETETKNDQLMVIIHKLHPSEIMYITYSDAKSCIKHNSIHKFIHLSPKINDDNINILINCCHKFIKFVDEKFI